MSARLSAFVLCLILLFTHAACAKDSATKDKHLAQLLAKYMPSHGDLKKKVALSKQRVNFSAISDSKQKKQAFVRFMLPLIQEANRQTLLKRQRLIHLLAQAKPSQALTNKSLKALCIEYKAGCNQASTVGTIITLLQHINIVPASLALAQSANESAWGTSRFATDANNYFGQWCFQVGCGLVPKSRLEGASYEVKTFASPLASVKSYIHNLNTSRSYIPLRQIRTQLVAAKKNIQGVLLADGLIKYSARGKAYVREIKQMIEHNQLAHYDVY